MRIAVAQTPGSQIAEWRRTRDRIDRMARRAADQRVDLLLLPECVWPAYIIPSRARYFESRRAGMPSDRDFVEHLRSLARSHRVGICAGYIAELDDRLANAAILVGPSGDVLGVRHKCFLWDADHVLFEPGRDIAPIETPWGLIGLMICADARLPEIPATLAARGARLILQPTAWVNCGPPDRLWNPQPELLIPERTREFHVPVASASKWGAEAGVTFVGSSIICDAAGRVLVQCGQRETELIVADVELGQPRPARVSDAQRARLTATRDALAPASNVPPIHAASPGSSRVRLWAREEIVLDGPTEGTIALNGVSLAAIDADDALSFAPIRVYALDGAHLVAVIGDEASDRVLRTRAAENRIFVVNAGAEKLRVYDPRGDLIGELPSGRRSARKLTALRLDVSQAADKNFAPHTNPFTNRRPETYEF